MKQIKVSNIQIDVVRKNIKNIHLAVYPPTGRVRIAAPHTTDENAIKLFAISKLGWIKRHQRTFLSQERASEREYKQRESHYFQGKRYLLNIIDDEKTCKIVLTTGKYINFYLKPDTTKEQRHKIVAEWYRKQLKEIVPPYISKWQKLLNVQVEEWQVKQMKTKWGSCNIEQKRIWLNLELAKKPVHCLEYIIVHEMVHLLERHHNELFIAYMNKFLPNWKALKKELNKLPVSHANWEY
jgi:predicted metal-dependent hydrolase